VNACDQTSSFWQDCDSGEACPGADIVDLRGWQPAAGLRFLSVRL